MNEQPEEILLLKALKSIKTGKKTKDPRLIILMGLPGSGKSYVSDYLSETHGYTVVSGENITFAIFDTERCSGSEYALVYKILRKIAAQLITEGYSVVIDGTNLRYIFRQQIYADVKCPKTALIYLTTDDITALKRVSHRGENYQNRKNIKSSCSEETFNNFKSQFEAPRQDEKSFTLISDDQLLVNVDLVIGKI